MERVEYPRPQLVRKSWENLNGIWEFSFDENNVGIQEQWYQRKEKLPLEINVPFAYQAPKSGIGNVKNCEVVWYRRNLTIEKREDKRYILHLGAVDYIADIFINGEHVGHHEGGHTSFEFDVTDYLLAKGDNSLVIRAFDPINDESIPRGKQSWQGKSTGIWYTNTTGIWQTVWLEEVSDVYIKSIKTTSLFDEGRALIEVEVSPAAINNNFTYNFSFKGEEVSKGNILVQETYFSFSVDLFQQRIYNSNYHHDGRAWTPTNPNLFDIQLSLELDGKTEDQVASYLGMRKIHTANGMVYLNNKPFYQKLVLDQGYWPEGLLTAPTDEDFVKDIRLAKEMGFNGCRKHQKVEDPRFLYWADKLGYLVWGECAAAPLYNNKAVTRLVHEWSEIIKRDYNHPCIVTWVPLNESWGVPHIQQDRQQQHFSQALYHYLHSLDTTRLVISNDGWSQTETDICAIHNYAHGNANEHAKYQYFIETLQSKENILNSPSSPWRIYANGFKHQGEPILLTEFGGIGFKTGEQKGWGYTTVGSSEEFVSEYRRVMDALYHSEILWGYCYTQLTDVEQEINGLLTYDRKNKCDLNHIKEINEGYHISNVKS